MVDIKHTYFDLRVKGEAPRFLLAYGGLKYEDERVALPWTDPAPWKEMKPMMPWGQVPALTWKGTRICQSMAICRFLAREIGIAGRDSLEMAQVDEIVDVIQDAINANYKAWYAPNRREELTRLTEQTFPTTLSQLERRLSERGQFFVGENFTWADLHLYFFCTEDFLSPAVLKSYPKLSDLVSRVGAMPNVKKWMETRPANGEPQKGFMIYFKNAYQILEEDLV